MEAALKNRVSYFVALLAVLTGAATTGHAFTLGDVRGNAVIGRSLDVSVPVLPGSGEEALGSCLSAEVLFGDLQQLTTSMAVTQVSSGPVPMALVRIRSGSLVDEPVVTVVLRSTCGSAVTRRYVLLSDFPVPDLPRSESQSTVELVPLVSSSQSTGSQKGSISADLTASEASASPTQTVPSRRKTAEASAALVVPKPAVKKRPSPPPVKTLPPTEPVPSKPVLKLDQPPVLPIQADAPPLAAQPASSPASAASEDALQQLARMEALQNDVKALKDIALKNEAKLADMQSKLRQAEAERVPMTWFYLVVGLLIASLGALTWVLRRQQNASKNDDAWWQPGKDEPSEVVNTVTRPTVQPEVPASDFGPSLVPPVVSATLVMQDESDPDLDIDLGSLTTTHDSPTGSPPTAMVQADAFTMAHNLNVEDVSDIRQQAEFFVSLGQTDRALNILRKQIMESSEPNPLVYLDLLSIYHAQGMKADFRELRAAFSRFFNGLVPDFPAFSLEGRDLLDYPEPLAVLVRFWPNIEAVAFLEACIFHNDAAPLQLSFDLAAFRDLLMLHAVAEKVTSDSPWKMTFHADMGGQNTGAAELVGLAMVMDMRGKAAAKEQVTVEDKVGEDVFIPLSVAGPPSHGLDMAFPNDVDIDDSAAAQNAFTDKKLGT